MEADQPPPAISIEEITSVYTTYIRSDSDRCVSLSRPLHREIESRCEALLVAQQPQPGPRDGAGRNSLVSLAGSLRPAPAAVHPYTPPAITAECLDEIRAHMEAAYLEIAQLVDTQLLGPLKMKAGEGEGGGGGREWVGVAYKRGISSGSGGSRGSRSQTEASPQEDEPTSVA